MKIEIKWTDRFARPINTVKLLLLQPEFHKWSNVVLHLSSQSVYTGHNSRPKTGYIDLQTGTSTRIPNVTKRIRDSTYGLRRGGNRRMNLPL